MDILPLALGWKSLVSPLSPTAPPPACETGSWPPNAPAKGNIPANGLSGPNQKKINSQRPTGKGLFSPSINHQWEGKKCDFNSLRIKLSSHHSGELLFSCKARDDCSGETYAFKFSERKRDTTLTQLRSVMRSPQTSCSHARDGISVGNASGPSIQGERNRVC